MGVFSLLIGSLIDLLIEFGVLPDFDTRLSILIMAVFVYFFFKTNRLIIYGIKIKI